MIHANINFKQIGQSYFLKSEQNSEGHPKFFFLGKELVES